MKIFISVNSTWNLVNFRAGLIKSFIQSGHDVFALSPSDKYVPQLNALGCQHIHISIDNKGVNPFKDLILIISYIKIFLKYKPEVYLGFTIKPNIYGSFVSKVLNVPFLNNVSGLGTVFIRESWVTTIVQVLYKIAFTGSSCIFFQNKDDQELFIHRKIVSFVNNQVIELLPGSGVNLQHFSPRFENTDGDGVIATNCFFTFLFVGRVLKDKGVLEFVDAARIVKLIYPRARFCILGFVDVKNSTAISLTQVNAWISEGLIEYLGEAIDVRDHISSCDCVVLPSYREGTPRSLLEAAAMGIPIIATDVAGCREVVVDGVNGFLCKPLDAKDLAAKMNNMIELKPYQRNQMGFNGRQKVEREFSEQIVIRKYQAAVDSLISQIKK